jgi:hypothetical protein
VWVSADGSGVNLLLRQSSLLSHLYRIGQQSKSSKLVSVSGFLCGYQLIEALKENVRVGE